MNRVRNRSRTKLDSARRKRRRRRIIVLLIIEAANLEAEDQRKGGHRTSTCSQCTESRLLHRSTTNPIYQMFGSYVVEAKGDMVWASDAASDQIARAIGHRLPPGWSNEGKIGDHGEASATMSAERREVTAFLNRKENECGGCQTRKESKCENCGATRCQQCSRKDTTRELCDKTWEGTST